MSISIVGAGTMARILGTRALSGGNTVEVIGRDAAKAAPAGAHVIKASNTLFGHVLAADQTEGRPLDVFIADDDAAAKARVSSFIQSLALRPLDTGDLTMAHWPEGAGLLMIPLTSAKPSRTTTSGSASTRSAERAATESAHRGRRTGC
jgi:predicted dinucleotide-binding enzyme